MRAATVVYFVHLVGRDLHKGSGQALSSLAFEGIRLWSSASKGLRFMHCKCWGTAHFTSAHKVW